jgi:hypothetical protein
MWLDAAELSLGLHWPLGVGPRRSLDVETALGAAVAWVCLTGWSKCRQQARRREVVGLTMACQMQGAAVLRIVAVAT